MRALIPHPADDPDLHEHYAQDWVDRGGIRVDMLSSADGAATASGKSAGLQTPGDNRVFQALRDLADVVLVGAGTAGTEGYAPIELEPDRIAARERFGFAPTLPTALVSRSLHVDVHSALLADESTLVLTCAAADAGRRAALGSRAILCGDDEVELDQVRAALAERGMTRVLCEGGPTLFAGVAAAGELDELCLSISPKLAGPGPIRIVGGEPWDSLTGLSLVGLLEEDGALFCRYRVGR